MGVEMYLWRTAFSQLASVDGCYRGRIDSMRKRSPAMRMPPVFFYTILRFFAEYVF